MESVQEITLHLPVDYDIPKFYEAATSDKIALALQIGAQAVQYLTESIAEEVRKERNSELVAQLEKKHLRRQELLEGEKRQLEENLEHLQSKFRLDEELKHVLREQIQEDSRAMYRELLEEKDKQIRHLQEQFLREMRGLQEKVQASNRTLGSQEKGKQGEVSMEEMIKTAFGSAKDFDLQSVGKEAQRGDHLMLYGNLRCMWEIKNYSRMVNKEEVEKLHRDMRSNPDIRIAFMVSLQSGIVGHTKAGDIDIESIQEGRFIVYITDFLKRREDPVIYLQTLRPLLDILDQAKDAKEGQEDEEASKLKLKLKIIHHLLLQHKTTLQTIHNAIYQQKKKSEQMSVELLTTIKQAESECANSIKELLTEEEKDEAVVEDQLNPELYRKTARIDLTETERKMVEWMQENCLEDPEGEMEVKGFMKSLELQFKTEKQLKEARGILQESVWPKQAKKIKGFRMRAVPEQTFYSSK